MRRAFTIVELLVGFAIVGLLLAISLPAVRKSQESARRMAVKADFGKIEVVAKMRRLDSNRLPTLADMDLDIPKNAEGLYVDPWGTPYKFVPRPYRWDGPTTFPRTAAGYVQSLRYQMFIRWTRPPLDKQPGLIICAGPDRVFSDGDIFDPEADIGDDITNLRR